jgi:hypothetical protein
MFRLTALLEELWRECDAILIYPYTEMGQVSELESQSCQSLIFALSWDLQSGYIKTTRMGTDM